ncbi:phage baseplate assembly protein V [Escherichia coli]|uniref:phage baseplate assembly protein V n=1 Tax=Escherichia coli TaxID=562 RepID=UPI00207B2040|nr:phage baseplate assembly protein V [Escherichia coli]
MNTLANIQELARALRNMIRTGIIVETDLNAGRCRVQTGGMCTDWLQWLTHRAGRSRTWWAPSVGEQVLILAVGGELDTAFVLRGFIPAITPRRLRRRMPCISVSPDGAVIEYEPRNQCTHGKRN